MASACSWSRRLRPTPPATMTPPSVPALAIRNRRRVHSGVCWSTIESAGPVSTAGRGASARRPSKATRPAATATNALPTASACDASGSRSAAAPARSPNATKRATPSRRRRVARTPPAAATTSATATTPMFRASLSFVPNRLTIRSFAPGGCRLITSDPIAATSDGAPLTRPATSSDAAIATPAASAPATAGRHDPSSARRRGIRPRTGAGPVALASLTSAIIPTYAHGGRPDVNVHGFAGVIGPPACHARPGPRLSRVNLGEPEEIALAVAEPGRSNRTGPGALEIGGRKGRVDATLGEHGIHPSHVPHDVRGTRRSGALNPLCPPLGGRERLRPVGRLADDLAVTALEDEDHLVRLGAVVELGLGDHEVARRDGAIRRDRRERGECPVDALAVLPAADDLAGLGPGEDRVVDEHFVHDLYLLGVEARHQALHGAHVVDFAHQTTPLAAGRRSWPGPVAVAFPTAFPASQHRSRDPTTGPLGRRSPSDKRTLPGCRFRAWPDVVLVNGGQGPVTAIRRFQHGKPRDPRRGARQGRPRAPAVLRGRVRVDAQHGQPRRVRDVRWRRGRRRGRHRRLERRRPGARHVLRPRGRCRGDAPPRGLSLIHISEPTRLGMISY